MAKIEQRPLVGLEITLTLTEPEARFLEGLAGFDHKATLEVLRQHCGTHYTEQGPGARDGAGFLSLMKTCQEVLPGVLRRMADARRVFEGLSIIMPAPGKG